MNDAAMNKRKHIRILVALKVTATTPAGFVTALTKNLSVGGLYLLTDSQRGLDGTVDLTLEHKGASVGLRATVNHRGGDGVGLSFVNPPRETIAALIAVIDDISSLGAGVDGGDDMLTLDPRLIMFRRGMLEYLGSLHAVGANEVTVGTVEVLRDGEQILLLLPTRSDGVHVREIVGSSATVIAVMETGFTAKLVNASAGFIRSLMRAPV